MKTILLILIIVLTFVSPKCEDSLCNLKCQDQHVIVDRKSVPCSRGYCFPSNINLCYCTYLDNTTYKFCNNVVFGDAKTKRRLK